LSRPTAIRKESVLKKEGVAPAPPSPHPAVLGKKAAKRARSDLFACPMCRLFDETIWSNRGGRVDPRDELLYLRHLETSHHMSR
jgi:hypothetical protein